VGTENEKGFHKKAPKDPTHARGEKRRGVKKVLAKGRQRYRPDGSKTASNRRTRGKSRGSKGKTRKGGASVRKTLLTQRPEQMKDLEKEKKTEEKERECLLFTTYHPS